MDGGDHKDARGKRCFLGRLAHEGDQAAERTILRRLAVGATEVQRRVIVGLGRETDEVEPERQHEEDDDQADAIVEDVLL